ncbi:11S globulin seed storage protein 1 [Euphorbia peplus]|nr:11S globulin seed storage protein 1 [Euphorbia peplus]
MSSKTKCEEIPHLLDKEPDIYFPGEAGEFKCGFFHKCSGNSTAKKNENECGQFYRYRSGDVGTRNGGELLWDYNDGNETTIVISLFRTSNNIDTLQIFPLGGPQNMLGGFDLKYITEAFNINSELALKLQRKDIRGNFINATSCGIDFSNVPIIQSCPRKDQQAKVGVSNVGDELREYVCNDNNSRIETLSDPSVADVFIPEVGYFTTIDAHKFPQSNQFSVSYNLLLEDVIRLPHWENTYRIILVVKGEGCIQVVDGNGKNVFDGVVKEGQVLIVPKYLVMAEKSNSKIFVYVTFMPNANPISYDISGRNSIVYGLPFEVLTNAFNITEEEAEKVKFGRNETTLAKIMPKNI